MSQRVYLVILLNSSSAKMVYNAPHAKDDPGCSENVLKTAKCFWAHVGWEMSFQIKKSILKIEIKKLKKHTSINVHQVIKTYDKNAANCN